MLMPDIAVRLTASGSFKQPQKLPQSPQGAFESLEASHTEEPANSVKAASSSAEGLQSEAGPGSPQSKAAGVGRPKVVRGRGPGRSAGRVPRGRRGH